MACPAATRAFRTGTGTGDDPRVAPAVDLLLRATRSLAATMGQDTANMSHWIKTENRGLQGVPKGLMKTVSGLAQTVQYRDAARANV